jgi:hypothetical protein
MRMKPRIVYGTLLVTASVASLLSAKAILYRTAQPVSKSVIGDATETGAPVSSGKPLEQRGDTQVARGREPAPEGPLVNSGLTAVAEADLKAGGESVAPAEESAAAPVDVLPEHAAPSVEEDASMQADEPQGPYPSPVQFHLDAVGERVWGLVGALQLDGRQAQALTEITAEHVRAERALWQEARIYSDGQIDPVKLEELDERTADAVRKHPDLGEGMAQVVQRVMAPLVRDPQIPMDPDQAQMIGLTELRRLASGQ